MPAQFTLPPDTRAAGTGNPPADMNSVVDALTAQGAVYNVLNAAYAGGADPTGVSDSAAAINAALAALPSSTGGTVVLPAGVYKITSPVVPTVSNSRLLGMGPEATTIRAAAGSNINGYQFDAATQAYNLIFCAIEGVTFDGNGNATGYGCHINYNLTHTFWDFYLRDVWFKNWGNDGFWSTGGHGYVLDHVLSEFNTGNGITFAGGFTDSPPRIVNGTVKLNTGTGVSVATVDAYIGHNEISTNSGGGLVLSASGCKAVGNQVRSNTGVGIKVTGGSEGHQVIGNTISSSTTHGLLIDDGNCSITANFFNNNSTASANTSDEIQVAHGTFNASGNMIVGNVIDGASQSRYGINLAHAGDTSAVLAANRIINEGTAQINSLVTDTVLLNAGNQAGMSGGYARMGSVVGWTCPPLFAQATALLPTAGALFMFQMEVFSGGTTANFNMFVTAAGNTLANVFAALVDTGGNIVASTVNRAADAALTTGGGALWTAPWSSSAVVAPGQYYGCLLIGSATTMPTFTCATNRFPASLANLGCTAGAVNLRVAATGSGLSALPGSPITMSGISSNQNAFWAALT